MCYLEFDLSGLEIKELSARLPFDIATARSLGNVLVKFSCQTSDGEKFAKAVASRLRDMKKRGKITLFATTQDFRIPTTEAAYLLNKFPELFKEKAPEGIFAFFVKL